MPKAIFIILTLAGFASGAEMEVTDRLSVDGSSIFKSTAVFSGNVGIGTAAVSGSRLAVNGNTGTSYSLTVGTSAAYNLVVSTTGNVGIGTTNPSRKFEVAGDIWGNVVYQGSYHVLDESMLDSFTLKLDTTTNKIKLADRIEQNIMLDAFKIAVSSSLSKFNMVDGIMDEFEDESGVDTVTSVNQSYNPSDDFYSPLVDSNKELDYMEYADDNSAKNSWASSDTGTGGIDEYTKLMLHCNGANGSQTIPDSGSTGHIVTQVGTAQLGAAGSCLLDGYSDYLTLADSADFKYGTGDFTIDMWIYPTALPNFKYSAIYATPDGNTDQTGIILMISPDGPTTSSLFLLVSNGSGGWGVDGDGGGTIVVNQWQHIALVRSGTSLKTYLNGSLVITSTYSGSGGDNGSTMRIGQCYTTSDRYFTGFMDEYRISKGIARWTSNFTPQTTPYTVDTYTKALLHMDGADTSTVFYDDTGKTVNTVGTAQISGKQYKVSPIKKFGDTALWLNGNSDYLTAPASTDWNFGTGNFTVDFWVRFNSIPNSGDAYFICHYESGTTGQWILNYNYSNNFQFQWLNNTWGMASGSWSPSPATWYHVALVRAGSIVKIFINGSQIGSDTACSIDFTNADSRLLIGANPGNVYFLNGWIDELRISKGIARWTSNFNTPAMEYDVGGNLNVYSEHTITRQGSYSLKATATIADSINDTLTKTLTGGSKINLSNYNTIKLDVYASRTGTNLQLNLHDSGGTTSYFNITVNSANSWETKTWDISGISNTNKDDIDSIVIQVTNADSANTFYVDNVYAVGQTYNMTLKSNATVAESTPAKARIVLFEEDVDTCTLNTDITASVSRDNGTTYSTATLANEGDWSTGKRILSGIVDISTQPSGTNMKWKVDTLNNRDIKLHGAGLSWD